MLYSSSNNRADRYNAIKKACYIDYPCPSQCVLNRTLGNSKGFNIVVTKLALPISAKMGGEPWMVRVPVQNCVIMGMDVHHPGKGNTRSSYVVFVASINNSAVDEEDEDEDREGHGGRPRASGRGFSLSPAVHPGRSRGDNYRDTIRIYSNCIPQC